VLFIDRTFACTCWPIFVHLLLGRPVSFGTGDDTGREPDYPSSLGDLPALLAAWRPGEEGGTAIVNLLLGDANPSGHLAQAWQRSAGLVRRFLFAPLYQTLDIGDVCNVPNSRGPPSPTKGTNLDAFP
jgi:hypothetical protein